MTIRTIILEDEVPAQNLLKSFLSDYEDIEICGVYADGYSGCKAINEQKPDLVILDIQMPKLTGIEVLELIDHDPVVIFTTAYDEFAVQAFQLNAIDYLLKPFSKDRFENAIAKATEKCASDLPRASTTETTEHLQKDNLQRIAVRHGSKIHIVACDAIDYIESDGDYVLIYSDGAKYMKEKTMKFYESRLPNNQFVRIHRSYIVNIDKIAKIEVFAKDQHIVVMGNGNKIKASANGYKILRKALDL